MVSKINLILTIVILCVLLILAKVSLFPKNEEDRLDTDISTSETIEPTSMPTFTSSPTPAPTPSPMVTPEIKEIHFESLGKLVTQNGFYTAVDVINRPADFYGKDVPFTESRVIYSYDGKIQVGYDFEKIETEISGRTITITLPEVEIISNELDKDSLKVYDEKRNIFSNIGIDSFNESQKKIQDESLKKMVDQGLFESARMNAEALIKAFVSSYYDLSKYTLVFR